jgi:L-rhamnono-1,4-lactonase
MTDGGRYLLQGRTAAEVQSIIGNEWFFANVREACEKGDRRLSFDVGIDAHRDGVAALEAVVPLIEGVGDGVNFVLSTAPPFLSLFPRRRLGKHGNKHNTSSAQN